MLNPIESKTAQTAFWRCVRWHFRRPVGRRRCRLQAANRKPNNVLMSQWFQFSLRALLVTAAMSGCSNPAAPPPAPTTLTFLSYTFVFEGGHDLSVAGHRNSVTAEDGTETELDEDISVKCGNHEARIVNGKLNVDGKDRGAVKPGNRITFTSAGGASVVEVAR